VASRTAGRKSQPHLGDAGYTWLLETQHKATHEDDKAKLAWLQTFLHGKQLTEINREVVEKIGETKREEPSAATANRYLALIQSILRKAWLEWEWIDKVPKDTTVLGAEATGRMAYARTGESVNARAARTSARCRSLRVVDRLAASEHQKPRMDPSRSTAQGCMDPSRSGEGARS